METNNSKKIDPSGSNSEKFTEAIDCDKLNSLLSGYSLMGVNKWRNNLSKLFKEADYLNEKDLYLSFFNKSSRSASLNNTPSIFNQNRRSSNSKKKVHPSNKMKLDLSHPNFSGGQSGMGSQFFKDRSEKNQQIVFDLTERVSNALFICDTSSQQISAVIDTGSFGTLADVNPEMITLESPDRSPRPMKADEIRAFRELIGYDNILNLSSAPLSEWSDYPHTDRALYGSDGFLTMHAWETFYRLSNEILVLSYFSNDVISADNNKNLDLKTLNDGFRTITKKKIRRKWNRVEEINIIRNCPSEIVLEQLYGSHSGISIFGVGSRSGKSDSTLLMSDNLSRVGKDFGKIISKGLMKSEFRGEHFTVRKATNVLLKTEKVNPLDYLNESDLDFLAKILESKYTSSSDSEPSDSTECPYLDLLESHISDSDFRSDSNNSSKDQSEFRNKKEKDSNKQNDTEFSEEETPEADSSSNDKQSDQPILDEIKESIKSLLKQYSLKLSSYKIGSEINKEDYLWEKQVEGFTWSSLTLKSIGMGDEVRSVPSKIIQNAPYLLDSGTGFLLFSSAYQNYLMELLEKVVQPKASFFSSRLMDLGGQKILAVMVEDLQPVSFSLCFDRVRIKFPLNDLFIDFSKEENKKRKILFFGIEDNDMLGGIIGFPAFKHFDVVFDYREGSIGFKLGQFASSAGISINSEKKYSGIDFDNISVDPELYSVEKVSNLKNYGVMGDESKVDGLILLLSVGVGIVCYLVNRKLNLGRHFGMRNRLATEINMAE